MVAVLESAYYAPEALQTVSTLVSHTLQRTFTQEARLTLTTDELVVSDDDEIDDNEDFDDSDYLDEGEYEAEEADQ